MKLVKCIIKPFKLEEVKEALASVGAEGGGRSLATTAPDGAGWSGSGRVFKVPMRLLWQPDTMARATSARAVRPVFVDPAVENIMSDPPWGRSGDGPSRCASRPETWHCWVDNTKRGEISRPTSEIYPASGGGSGPGYWTSRLPVASVEGQVNGGWL